MGGLSPIHWIAILGVVLVLFGPSQLPKLGKSLGETMKSVRAGMDEATAATADEDEE